jgi:hypothetical protein
MKNKKIILIIILLVVIIAGGIGLFSINKSKNSTVSNGCISQTSKVASMGHCVSDLQTMVNFMETDSLNQCPFNGSIQVPISGVYDGITEQQVRVIQTWVNCYNKQENNGENITVNGQVDPSTWSALCTYAYIYPNQSQQSNSPFLKQSLAAGKDAGCKTT